MPFLLENDAESIWGYILLLILLILLILNFFSFLFVVRCWLIVG